MAYKLKELPEISYWSENKQFDIIDDDGKEIKVIVLDKDTSKKLKRKEGSEFRNKDIQTFIAQFYREESMREFINN